MKTRIAVILGLTLCSLAVFAQDLCPAIIARSTPLAKQTPRFKDTGLPAHGDSVVVTTHRPVSEVLNILLAAFPAGASPLRQVRPNMIVFPTGELDAKRVAALFEDPKLARVVRYAEVNYSVTALGYDDPLRKYQCSLDVVEAERAWEIYKPTRDVVVALIDSGIASHCDLPAASTSVQMDDNGHGTHLAGIIVALTGNGKGVAGATGPSGRITVRSYRFLNAHGHGNVADASAQIHQAVDDGVDIILCGWGTAGNSMSVREALQRALQNDIVVIAAAGNENGDNDRDAVYPANYAREFPNVVSVMATDCDDAVTCCTNVGADAIDLAAPGGGVPNQMVVSTVRDDHYGYQFGTSMAAAYVAAAAAMIRAQDSTLGSDDVKRRLLRTADRVAVLKEKCVSGARLNLAKAVDGSKGDGIRATRKRVGAERDKRQARQKPSIAK